MVLSWSVITPRLVKYFNSLPTGVRKELEQRNPKDDSGRRKNRHHQWLTEDIGHPALQQHLIGVMALMRAAPNWSSFKRNLARAYRKVGDQLPMPIDED